MSEVYALLSVFALYMRPYRTTHRASVQNHCCPIRIGLTAFNFGNTIARGQNEHGKKRKRLPFNSVLHCCTASVFSDQDQTSLIIFSGSSFHSAISSLQFLKDVCFALLFAECYQEIFLSVLAAGIPLLGCVSLFFFHHQIKRTQVC